VVPPGPENPLGSHALILGMPSYLLHGTNRPAGVGMRVSHGCVRLFPENIEKLYSRIDVGTSVTIVDQPWLLGWQDDRLYLEAHQPLLDDERDWPSVLPGLIKFEMIAAPYLRNGEPDPHRTHRITEMALGIPLPVLAEDDEIEAHIEQSPHVNNVVAYKLAQEQLAQQDDE
jgi:L,D-transpeptidase ErfK/SrfK